jgi:hypothetical protein
MIRIEANRYVVYVNDKRCGAFATEREAQERLTAILAILKS